MDFFGLAGQVIVTAGFTVLIFASIIYYVAARSFGQLIRAGTAPGRHRTVPRPQTAPGTPWWMAVRAACPSPNSKPRAA